LRYHLQDEPPMFPTEASMLASIAINETAKGLAFQFIDRGYKQACQNAVCPICGKKYLVLLDPDAYERGSPITEPVQTTALDCFVERLRQTHNTGHCEEQLLMP
jgi:hypothetical protein